VHNSDTHLDCYSSCFLQLFRDWCCVEPRTSFDILHTPLLGKGLSFNGVKGLRASSLVEFTSLKYTPYTHVHTGSHLSYCRFG